MDKKVTKQWWDKYMENNYFTDFSFAFSRPELISLFKIKENTRVLEIGFGYGRETSQFCLLSKNVYGVDLAENAKNIAMEKISAIPGTSSPKLFSYDGTKLPFDDNMFDFIYSCFVVQHMSKSSAIDLLKECKRVLHQNGYMLFEFFGDPAFYKPGLDNDAFSGDPENKEHPFLPRQGMYNNAFTVDEIKLLVQKSGLEYHWEQLQVISKGFNNYWACMVKGK